MNKLLISILFIIFGNFLNAQTQNILFIGGIAHIGNGTKIDNSAIAINNGKFTLVSKWNSNIDTSLYDTIIDIANQHIYPGFIAVNTTLGITEISAVRATRDYNETGDFKPHVRSLTSYNTESKIIPTIRTNGILLAQVAPKGGIITGTSSIMNLEGWNWEDAVYKKDDGIHLNWPKYFQQSGWWAEPGSIKKTDNYNSKVKKIEDYFNIAKSYFNSNKSKIDLELDATEGLFTGEKRLYIHANLVKEITDAILFSKKIGIKHIVIIGGNEAHLITDFINEYNVPILLDRIHRLPLTEDTPIDMPYRQANILHKNGILFGFCYQGDMEAMGQRNLPFSAGTAVSYGLPYDEAISSLSLNTATILGIENKVGSITKGKFATFFISTGDALDMKSNNLTYVYIEGKKINLNNHQSDLYNKYKSKYQVK